MLGEGLDLAEAAFRVGYESPSRFGSPGRLSGIAPGITTIELWLSEIKRGDQKHEDVRAGRHIQGTARRSSSWRRGHRIFPGNIRVLHQRPEICWIFIIARNAPFEA
jgi:hypothetical protein